MATMDEERSARLEAIEQLRGLACDLQVGTAGWWEATRRAAPEHWSADERARLATVEAEQVAEAYARARAVVYALQELERAAAVVYEPCPLCDAALKPEGQPCPACGFC